MTLRKDGQRRIDPRDPESHRMSEVDRRLAAESEELKQEDERSTSGRGR